MLTALVVRLALIKLYINASDQGARIARASAVMKPLQQKITAATAAGNMQARIVLTQQLRDVMKKEGVSYLKMLAPFSQVFLGYGTFRLMRGMADLPVPGLDEGGFLWLTDLTVADPFYLMPVVTSAMMYFTFKVSGLPFDLTTFKLCSRPTIHFACFGSLNLQFHYLAMNPANF